MKKLIISSTLFVASFSASAADLPSLKTGPDSGPLPLWTGFYAGLNAGYGFGSNSAINSINYGAQKSYLNVLATPNAVASAFSGSASNTQNGFIGGFQLGYNYQIGQRFVLGLETDIQGSNIYGSSATKGAGLFTDTDTIAPLTGTGSGSLIGSQSISAGLDYIGTLRARAGYLFTPTLLVYGTAGFSYGGAYARVNSYGIESLSGSFSATGVIGSMIGANTYAGANRQSQLLTGWNAGTGAEWMFMPNWSLKGEAIYWNLGNMNVSTTALGLSPVNYATADDGAGNTVSAPITSNAISSGNTKVNYQGIIARAGLNYHFSGFGASQSKTIVETSSITPLSWNGVYAGLNAGYNFGTNSNISSVNYGAQRTISDIIGVPTGMANALSMNSNNTQNGYIGGMQLGYNYLFSQNYVAGIETDIQGANIFGASYKRGGGIIYAESDTSGSNQISSNGTALGSQAVDTGISYLGTLRGRLGYLPTPTLLTYTTAGLSYGGAFARINNYAIDSLTATATSTSGGITSTASAAPVSTYYGASEQSQLLVGWNAGGGFEWMFQPNWSLKGEAIYWNLGNMNTTTSSFSASPASSFTINGRTIPLVSNSIASGSTQVNYQGIIARAGINYHFSWVAPPAVSKF